MAVEAAIKAAIDEDPDFVKGMWKTLDKDPARAAWANQLLEGTRYERGAQIASRQGRLSGATK